MSETVRVFILSVGVGVLIGFVIPVGLTHAYFTIKRRRIIAQTLAAFDAEFPEDAA